jgi:hypothetical protein
MVLNRAMKFLWFVHSFITSLPWSHCCLADASVFISCLYLYCSKTGEEWLQTTEAQEAQPNSSLSWSQLPPQDRLMSWLKSCSLTSALHLYQCLHHTGLASPWTIIYKKKYCRLSKCPELWCRISFWGLNSFA